MGPRLRFERDVRAFLRKSGYDAAHVDEALARLKELRLVSDEDTCRAFLRDRMRFAPKGRTLLLRELVRKGAPDAVAKAALDDVLAGDFEIDAAAEFLRRSARKWARLPAADARQRMYAALARRGFPRDVARAALTKAAGESPDDDGLFHEEDDGAHAPFEP
jgi:regulatory protein